MCRECGEFVLSRHMGRHNYAKHVPKYTCYRCPVCDFEDTEGRGREFLQHLIRCHKFDRQTSYSAFLFTCPEYTGLRTCNAVGCDFQYVAESTLIRHTMRYHTSLAQDQGAPCYPEAYASYSENALGSTASFGKPTSYSSLASPDITFVPAGMEDEYSDLSELDIFWEPPQDPPIQAAYTKTKPEASGTTTKQTLLVSTTDDEDTRLVQKVDQAQVSLSPLENVKAPTSPSIVELPDDHHQALSPRSPTPPPQDVRLKNKDRAKPPAADTNNNDRVSSKTNSPCTAQVFESRTGAYIGVMQIGGIPSMGPGTLRSERDDKVLPVNVFEPLTSVPAICGTD